MKEVLTILAVVFVIVFVVYSTCDYQESREREEKLKQEAEYKQQMYKYADEQMRQRGQTPVVCPPGLVPDYESDTGDKIICVDPNLMP